jgi:hypothetical protein
MRKMSFAVFGVTTLHLLGGWRKRRQNGSGNGIRKGGTWQRLTGSSAAHTRSCVRQKRQESGAVDRRRGERRCGACLRKDTRCGTRGTLGVWWKRR